MESTAEAQVDLSALLSADAFAMLFAARRCHAREAPREDQRLVETRFSCIFTTRRSVTGSWLLGDANVEEVEGAGEYKTRTVSPYFESREGGGTESCNRSSVIVYYQEVSSSELGDGSMGRK